jgi:hypothetical protein
MWNLDLQNLSIIEQRDLFTKSFTGDKRPATNWSASLASTSGRQFAQSGNYSQGIRLPAGLIILSSEKAFSRLFVSLVRITLEVLTARSYISSITYAHYQHNFRNRCCSCFGGLCRQGDASESGDLRHCRLSGF